MHVPAIYIDYKLILTTYIIQFEYVHSKFVRCIQNLVCASRFASRWVVSMQNLHVPPEHVPKTCKHVHMSDKLKACTYPKKTLYRLLRSWFNKYTSHLHVLHLFTSKINIILIYRYLSPNAKHLHIDPKCICTSSYGSIWT
jgi:hypothetical protein